MCNPLYKNERCLFICLCEYRSFSFHCCFVDWMKIKRNIFQEKEKIEILICKIRNPQFSTFFERYFIYTFLMFTNYGPSFQHAILREVSWNASKSMWRIYFARDGIWIFFLKCPKTEHIQFRCFSRFKIDHVIFSRNVPLFYVRFS